MNMRQNFRYLRRINIVVGIFLSHLLVMFLWECIFHMRIP